MVRLPKADDSLVLPEEHLHLLPAGTRIFRVHPKKYKPSHGRVKFNDSDRGNARFSPLLHDKRVVPTVYAGLTLECALMETVFHDLPPKTGVILNPAVLDTLVATEILLMSDVRLVDLTSVGLKRIGLENRELIDTLPSTYKATQAWAAALYAANPVAHGLYWTSRQDNRTQAMMFFGDRPKMAKTLKPVGHVIELQRPSGGPILEVLKLAEKLGVDFSV